MEKLKISTAQFEHKSADKVYNLSMIEALTADAARQGADVIAFHECSVTGYTFARNCSREELLDIAEYIPDGPSVRALIDIAGGYNITILAGLFEKDHNGRMFKAYICVDKGGLVAKYRKLHPFINPHLTPGDQYCVFEIKGWKCGILICYDNNVIENVRATRLLGAEIIFMPHVTMCTPSTRPGAGFVAPALWHNRANDPTSLRSEFEGLKGRAWLMKWLPARAYDNGVYVVFSNPIGMDDDQLKNGCSMILDPFGDILAECRSMDNEIATSVITREKLRLAGGFRYIEARRPDVYRDIIGQTHMPRQKVAWLSAPASTGNDA
ncbi:nitrilase family protein [Pedobacter sp. SYP-B3415]|uniref:nitrilase family protein n=1 Tax=Pedobacter sp. SYP-B3415 TaxID=2496641 RepID=UPI00101D48FC|nr:nitrilase family protein [Pedobacter sp. SYP-B3415]